MTGRRAKCLSQLKKTAFLAPLSFLSLLYPSLSMVGLLEPVARGTKQPRLLGASPPPAPTGAPRPPPAPSALPPGIPQGLRPSRFALTHTGQQDEAAIDYRENSSARPPGGPWPPHLGLAKAQVAWRSKCAREACVAVCAGPVRQRHL